MEKGLHVELHEGEKENNQRRKMSDELLNCKRCPNPIGYYSPSEELCVDCWKAVWDRLDETESRLKIAVEALELLQCDCYSFEDSGMSKKVQEALTKIRST